MPKKSKKKKNPYKDVIAGPSKTSARKRSFNQMPPRSPSPMQKRYDGMSFSMTRNQLQSYKDVCERLEKELSCLKHN